MKTSHAKAFSEANPNVHFLSPSMPGYRERRATRGEAGQELIPLGIAVPNNAKQVCDIVLWALKAGVEFAVRSGGNDFYGRNVIQDGLVIDMRDMNAVEISDDKRTATIGGGVIGNQLLEKFEEENIMAPLGNLGLIGYIGWATLGGYGPFTNMFGMGYEGIIGAQIVNANGELVRATDEELEAIRGMGGNIGIITSLTFKTYPARQLLSGPLVFEFTPENVRQVVTVEEELQVPSGLTLHHFMMKAAGRSLITFFTWAKPDLEEGRHWLDTFLAAMPPPKMNGVTQKSTVEHYESIPVPRARWGGQRALYIKQMSPYIVDTVIEAFESMPAEANIGWTAKIETNTAKSPKNCFGANTHHMLSFADTVSEEGHLSGAREWSDALLGKLRSSTDNAILEGEYPPLSRPGDRTSRQLFGEKWARAKELKTKYDPQNVFQHAIPSFI